MGQHKREETASNKDREPEHQQELDAFGMVLKRMRKERGLSQEELAWDAQLDPKFVSMLERGRKEPGYRTILKLARALGCTSGHLMSEVDEAIKVLVTASASGLAPPPR